MSDRPPVIAVVGPTASGKSELAEALARLLDGEIISADSMQVYRGMDIGTAKIPVAKRTVPYHCIDILDPGESYSAACFQLDSRAAIESIYARGKQPIVCGGTGLYVRAALDDFNFPSGEQDNNPVRQRYSELLDALGEVRLHAILTEVDPASAELIHPHNSRRVIRALEMHEQGISYAEQLSGFSEFRAYYDACYIGLTAELEYLYERINARVDLMFENGLESEVGCLLDAGFRKGLTAQSAIGYKELVAYFEGSISRDEAIEDIKRSTRRYAKRQRSWFKRDPRITFIDIERKDLDEICCETAEILRSKGFSWR